MPPQPPPTLCHLRRGFGQGAFRAPSTVVPKAPPLPLPQSSAMRSDVDSQGYPLPATSNPHFISSKEFPQSSSATSSVLLEAHVISSETVSFSGVYLAAVAFCGVLLTF